VGVMPCRRIGCANILCDRLSQKYGYICNECFEELVNSTLTDIEEFMETDKSKGLFNSSDSRREVLELEFFTY